MSHHFETPRFDIYAGIHKALRCLMSDTLARLGRCDLDHEADLHDTLDRVAHMLSLLAGHLDSENQVLHTAIEARQPEGARQTTDDHRSHVQSIAALSEDVLALRRAPLDQRPSMALRLYRHLALFVAENLEHMNVEETSNNATLWSLFTDAEIAGLEGQIVDRLSPEKRAAFLRWFAISMSTQELTAFLQAMRQAAPPEAFQASLTAIRAELAPARWDRLATALAMQGATPMPLQAAAAHQRGLS